MITNDPRIVTLGKKNLVGICTFMTLEEIGGPEVMLWEIFSKLDSTLKIKRKETSPHNIELEIYPEKEYSKPENPMTERILFMAGVEVDNLNEIPPGCVGKTLPATEYAIFTYTGKPVDMVSAYKHIFLDWMPQSQFIQSYNFDYAYYNGRCNGPYDEDSVIDIYIPVKKK